MIKCTVAPAPTETGSAALPEAFWVGEYQIHPGVVVTDDTLTQDEY